MSFVDWFRRLSGSMPSTHSAANPDSRQLATAVLLVEAMRADFSEHPSETRAIEKMLARHFGIDAAASEALLEDARDEADRSVSLHDYTRLLHSGLSAQEKAGVIEMLWGVVLVDEELDKYEDYLLRKVAELLYVPHPELIRLKHKVQQQLADLSEG